MAAAAAPDAPSEAAAMSPWRGAATRSGPLAVLLVALLLRFAAPGASGGGGADPDGDNGAAGVCGADGSDTCAATAAAVNEASLPVAPLSPRERRLIEQSRAYGEEQFLTPDARREQQLRLLEDMDAYMRNTVYQELKYVPVQQECRNRHDLCTFWAAIGECQQNAAYMLPQCAPACRACHHLIYKERCPYEDGFVPDAWGPGDLGSFFTNLTTREDYVQAYTPTVLSRPQRGGVRGDNPWIVTLEHFLSDEECETLIRLGAQRGFERSEDVGHRNVDGSYGTVQSAGRTSTNAWCLEDCYEHAVTQAVLRRIEALTGIPDRHSEYLQLLKYEEGEFYEEHHDFIAHHVRRAQGPRILTIFLYLNDVDEGGGTRFTDLDITVTPRRGRAVLWPSVLDGFLNVQEPRTHHEALPVVQGTKYGANAWIHLRDFKTPFLNNCI